MMRTDSCHQKVNAGHLKRNAYLYVRQSTLRQVLENTESTMLCSNVPLPWAGLWSRSSSLIAT